MNVRILLRLQAYVRRFLWLESPGSISVGRQFGEKTTTKQEVVPTLETERFVRTQKWKTWLWLQVNICLLRCDIETFRSTIAIFLQFYLLQYFHSTFIWSHDWYHESKIPIKPTTKAPPGLMFGAPHWESVGTACKHLGEQQFGDIFFMLQSHLTMTFLLTHLFFQSLSKYIIQVLCAIKQNFKSQSLIC